MAGRLNKWVKKRASLLPLYNAVNHSWKLFAWYGRFLNVHLEHPTFQNVRGCLYLFTEEQKLTTSKDAADCSWVMVHGTSRVRFQQAVSGIVEHARKRRGSQLKQGSVLEITSLVCEQCVWMAVVPARHPRGWLPAGRQLGSAVPEKLFSSC